MRANEIVNVLNKFKDSTYYQKILIDGSWGIGKTKYVLDFIKEHNNACYVSLFGKKDIDSIIQEIYFQIIENVENRNLKKASKVIREKLKNINLQLPGISVTVPLIGNIHNTLHKELKNTDTFIIIFDDLERKHHDLNIKEVFGLIDSLARLDNVKTVMIAATDQLESCDKEIFNNYQEKAVDRTYIIKHYAKNAPIQILGLESWEVIGKYTKDLTFSNLRTYEKTNLFIKEVTETLGEEVFTDKFTKDDIIRICFATILFKVEHKSEMVLLNTIDSKSEFQNAYYATGVSGVVEYICNYILKNSLDNIMSKNALRYIINWYETGAYSEDIIYVINSINSVKENPKNFYSSEHEIIESIEHCRNYIRNLKGDERIEDIYSKISSAFQWCELLGIDFGISNEKILDKLKDNISNNIDLEKSLYQNQIDTFLFNPESENARQLILSIDEAIQVEYQEQLIQRIIDCLTENSYKIIYLRNLTDLVRTASSQIIKDKLINSIEENQFFFPLPSGRITEEHWFWCHQINIIMKDIEQHWDLEDYYNKFKAHVYSLVLKKEDKLLKHRISTLFDR